MSKVFDSYAAYYDLLYRDKDYKLEVDYIVKLLKKYKVSSGDILELGSGTGKHAAHLANFGFNIHGIDLSKSMIDIANSQNKLENTSYEVGDVRTYRINKLFDVVISLFHVASYQSSNSDLEDMFLTAATHLIPGGVLTTTQVFDFIDSLFFMLAIPNIIGLYILAPELKADLADYLARLKSGEIKKVS